jgi:hypothetical protein
MQDGGGLFECQRFFPNNCTIISSQLWLAVALRLPDDDMIDWFRSQAEDK